MTDLHNQRETPGSWTSSAERVGTNGAEDRHGGGLADRVRERAEAQLSTQKDRATDGLGSIAQAVRGSTQQLREQRYDVVAKFVEQAADQLEQISTRLKERDVRDLLDDVQQFARRQPAVVVGSAFAIGIAAARFLKSSPPDNDYGARRGKESQQRGAAQLPSTAATASRATSAAQGGTTMPRSSTGTTRRRSATQVERS
jgi:hypothetical protein